LDDRPPTVDHWPLSMVFRWICHEPIPNRHVYYVTHRFQRSGQPDSSGFVNEPDRSRSAVIGPGTVHEWDHEYPNRDIRLFVENSWTVFPGYRQRWIGGLGQPDSSGFVGKPDCSRSAVIGPGTIHEWDHEYAHGETLKVFRVKGESGGNVNYCHAGFWVQSENL
jgi:hypothetical protein